MRAGLIPIMFSHGAGSDVMKQIAYIRNACSVRLTPREFTVSHRHLHVTNK